MHVLVTGATGFVGRALVQRLIGRGDRVTAWVRNPHRARNQLGAAVSLCAVDDRPALLAALGAADAVVNLAGESVIGRRWSKARRAALHCSRVELTRSLVQAIGEASPRPPTLLSASAVGYYGDRGAEVLDEDSEAGEGFLAELCGSWERAAQDAEALGVRVACLRIGIVLGEGGGMLDAVKPLFALGLGGPIGSGKQYLPWIHIDDLVDIFVRGLDDDRVGGALNATAPTPVSSGEFASVLGKALGRPALLPAPRLALRALLGQRSALLLQGQRARPVRLEALGHRFEHPQLPTALASILATTRSIRLSTRGAEQQGVPARATHVLESRTQLRGSPEAAFGFFCRAENLALITPSWLHLEIDGPVPTDMVEGAVIRYRIRIGPLPVRWKTVIHRWDPPRSFVDNQAEGPYRLWWHEHRIESNGGGTTMLDRVYYTPPLGVLGRIANSLWIASTLRRIFAYRAEAIARLYGGTSPAAD